MEQAPATTFAEHVARGELGYQVDADGRALWPPSVAGVEWRASAGAGTVYSTTTVRRRDAEPDDISLIDLDEGFRMMSRVVGVPADEVRIGMRVRVAFDDGVPVFEVQGMSGVVIAGAAESDLGEVGAAWTPIDLMAQASLRALADCGLTAADVDGLFASSTQLPWASINLGQALRIEPRYSDSTMVGGSSPIAHINHARAAIRAGLCDVALIAYGSTQRSVGRANASVQEIDPYEKPYAPMLPVTAYGLAAARHMHEFGTTPEQLAWVAVAARQWAQQTPGAWSTKDLTVDDVLAAPRVCDPLGVKDCCLVTDGGGAIVVVSESRARELRRPPVHVLGVGEAHSHRHISAMPDLVRTSAARSGAHAYVEAGVTADDVDSLQLYDAFTITPILFAEDLGFCKKGEGGAFFDGGRTGPGGEGPPVNTNGGGLSYQHPGMNGMLMLVEGVRRIREVGDDVALVHGNGGVLSSQCTVLLGSGATR